MLSWWMDPHLWGNVCMLKLRLIQRSLCLYRYTLQTQVHSNCIEKTSDALSKLTCSKWRWCMKACDQSAMILTLKNGKLLLQLCCNNALWSVNIFLQRRGLHRNCTLCTNNQGHHRLISASFRLTCSDLCWMFPSKIVKNGRLVSSLLPTIYIWKNKLGLHDRAHLRGPSEQSGTPRWTEI